MIELQPARLPDLTHWFPVGAPGVAALAEHVRATGSGRWWADRAVDPRVVAVSSGDHALLRGNPQALAPAALAPLASLRVQAPAHFLPALSTAFTRLDPGERMVYVHHTSALASRPPRGVAVRRLTAADATATAGPGGDARRLHATWGGPYPLAASGVAWGAFHRGGLLAVAGTCVLGSRYEDVAVLSPPDPRQHLALACVTALCADIAARGRIPTWTCSGDDRPGRLLAWRAGFRLEREYVEYATGDPVRTEEASGPDRARARA
ncbi:GNAT family N-acetyltransferase [Streptomyces sp. NBC_01237]|uniref:GNAT family N-acetyltransferase n=1 Tax=Streptomyces sp. NBC_01237 TaxID=2903790 RepID=UPI002DDB3417|nr:GNAT family N-acetyltransferase [Streptomyces sp. NBC_01237]WRZ75654.1 GNAT family N-acetyltransferase [Streptomyces sp. NBC_01237]